MLKDALLFSHHVLFRTRWRSQVQPRLQIENAAQPLLPGKWENGRLIGSVDWQLELAVSFVQHLGAMEPALATNRPLETRNSFAALVLRAHSSAMRVMSQASDKRLVRMLPSATGRDEMTVTQKSTFDSTRSVRLQRRQIVNAALLGISVVRGNISMSRQHQHLPEIVLLAGLELNIWMKTGT